MSGLVIDSQRIASKTRTRRTRYRYEITAAPAAEDLAATAMDWQALQRSYLTSEALYQSLDWFSHLASYPEAELLLVRVFDEADTLVGNVPVRIVDSRLQYWVTSYHQLRPAFRCATILGSEPLLPDDPECHLELIRQILKAVPSCSCVMSKTVRTRSLYHKALKTAGRRLRDCLIYYPDGERVHHYVELPDDFNDYLSKFSSKTRNTLRRKLKKVVRQFGEPASVERFTSEATVGRFVELAARVSAGSWQHRELGPRILDDEDHRLRFADVARRGVLRSYVLMCGGEPRAFVVGYQYDGVFHYSDVAYDSSFAAFSPGTMLVYLLIEDLIAHDRPQTLDFGIGEAAYKEFWGTSTIDVVSVWAFRRSLRNALIAGSHRAFRSIVRRAKKRFRASYEGQGRKP